MLQHATQTRLKIFWHLIKMCQNTIVMEETKQRKRPWPSRRLDKSSLRLPLIHLLPLINADKQPFRWLRAAASPSGYWSANIRVHLLTCSQCEWLKMSWQFELTLPRGALQSVTFREHWSMGGGDIRRTPIQISGPRWPGVQQREAWVKRQQEKTGEKEGDTQLAAPGTQEKQKRKRKCSFYHKFADWCVLVGRTTWTVNVNRGQIGALNSESVT